nr:immunoglobulin domain-containing protein [Maliibacterium massiliense]
MKKRLFAAFVCLCMIVSLLPTMAFAEAGVQDSGIVTSASGLCEHHTQHDESCGYTEGTAEIPCSHEHDESCGGLTDPEACNHSHDEACGYVPATEGTPCTYVCEICNAQDSGNPATPSDAQPEECTCETLCTEEEINADCPVCSVEGAELDKVCVGAAPMLPVTALAARNDRPYSLYVGNTDVAKTEYSDNAAYWTSSDGGTNWTSQLDKPTADSYIHYDGNGTLTLHNVNISRSNENGIYAEAMSGSAVSLTIKLEEENKVSGASGIYVFSRLGDASLSISGTGSLTAEGTGGGSFSGIQVQSNDGKAELTINNVDVTATNNVAQGIILRSGGSSTASLTVNGGELTASGSDAGIKYVFGSSGTGGGTPTVTVSNNAIVRANGGISDDSSTDIQIGADSNESNGGIVFDGKNGTVYGDVTLQEDITIGEGESLTLDDNASLNAGNHNVIVDGGTLDENLANSLGNSVKYAPTITTQPTSQTVTEGGTAIFTVVTSGTEPLSYQWQQSTDSGQSWTDIGGATDATYTTEATTTSMNGYQYRCVVSNSAGSITSDAVSLTVNEHVHTWGNPVWSWSEDGKTCTVTFTCEKDENHKESPKVDVTSAVKTPATCTETGVTTYTATVEFNGQTYTDTKDVADIPATGHSYGEPVWNWSEDGKTCTVTFTCEKDETHKQTPEVKVTSAVKTPATCTETGVTTYTATVEFNGQTYTNTKDVADIPATGHSYDNGKCTVCGAIASDFKVIITAGTNGSWQKGTKDGLTFTSNAAYKHFQKVQVDGKDLDASNYTVKEGSTIVTLKAEYLETLSDGKHTLAIVSETGTATTEFTIKAAAVTDDTQSPQTGDDSNIALWIAVLLAAGTALTGTAVYSRKRKYSK